jgi:cystathionine beta-lyase
VADSGFVVTSAAKAFNLAGLKAGLIVAGPGSRTSLRALPESVPHGASHLGVIGHCAGYRADPTWLDEVNANIASNRRRLTDLIAEHLPAVTYREPEATYLAWLDFRATSIVGDPAGAILKGARVALTAGAPFGPGGSGHARLNMACSAAMLERAVLGIARALGGERVE